MKRLVVQQSAMPTRKIFAVIIAGMLAGLVQSLLKVYWPGHPFGGMMADLDIWIQALIMVIAGYVTKEKENVATPVDNGTTQQG